MNGFHFIAEEDGVYDCCLMVDIPEDINLSAIITTPQKTHRFFGPISHPLELVLRLDRGDRVDINFFGADKATFTKRNLWQEVER